MSEPTAFDWPAGRQWQRRLLIAGAVGVGLCGAGAIFDVQQSLRSYLFAWFAWLGFAVGSLGLWMLHNLTGGAWGFALRRIFEAATRTLPLMAVLFAPIALGAATLYPWAALDAHELGSKTDVLNVPFFLARAAIYLAVWLGAAFLLNRWSNEHDRTGDPVFVHRAQNLSGPGLLFLAVTVTFASIDWVMSLEPAWYSTIFGALVGAGYLLAALALALGVATLTPADTEKDVWNDLGNLLLAFVMLWTYMAFSQFLLIWSGNLPEEIVWYLHRTEGGWQWVGLSLAVGYFALPFCVLLSRDVKRSALRLRVLALLIVGMSVIDTYWLIAPAFSPGELRVHWQDLAACIGVGGLWLHQMLRQLQMRPLLPVHEPVVEEVQHA